MPADSANRTLVLSVVAVDMVGYSRVSVAEQMSLKDNFNQALVRAIRHLSAADRIILDTGDGVAMGFLGDPEDALYVAMFMHDAVNRVSPGIRIGINLGPVKLSTGVGGHPNIIGDGINVAERIMTFAEPGQCMVSRPYYELMSRMSGQYASLFESVGMRTDSQVRVHDVYVMRKSAAAFQQARQGVTERAAQRIGPVADTASPLPMAAAPVMTTSAAQSVERHSGLIDFLEDSKKVAIAATLLAVIAVGLGATLTLRKAQTNAPENAAPLVAASVQSPAVSVRSSPAAVIPAPASTSPAVKATSPAPISPPPASASAAAVKAAPQAPPPKPEIKSAPTPVSAAVGVATPAATPGSAREKPLDARIEKSERIEKAIPREPISDTPRKPAARTGAEREQSAPPGAAPVVPTFQAPQQAPRTESVAPTPAASPAPTPALAQPAPAVSTEAVVVSRSAPPFPVEGIRQGLQTGFVKARLTIDARGNVTSVDILESKPIPAFGRETRNAVKDWKFNTGTPDRTYDIEFTFKL